MAADLPPSSVIEVEFDSAGVLTVSGAPIDADADGMSGGVLRSRFATLPLSVISTTGIWGIVRDSYTGEVLPGVTVRVDAVAGKNAMTNATGHFVLMGLPSPDVFVHIGLLHF